MKKINYNILVYSSLCMKYFKKSFLDDVSVENRHLFTYIIERLFQPLMRVRN